MNEKALRIRAETLADHLNEKIKQLDFARSELIRKIDRDKKGDKKVARERFGFLCN